MINITRFALQHLLNVRCATVLLDKHFKSAINCYDPLNSVKYSTFWEVNGRLGLLMWRDVSGGGEGSSVILCAISYYLWQASLPRKRAIVALLSLS